MSDFDLSPVCGDFVYFEIWAYVVLLFLFGGFLVLFLLFLLFVAPVYWVVFIFILVLLITYIANESTCKRC